MNIKDKLNNIRARYGVAAKARHWYMEQKSNSMKPKTQAKFQAWLAENPIHKEQYDLVDTIWECTDVLQDHPLIISDLKDQPRQQPKIMIGQWYEKLRPRIQVLKPLAIAATAVIITVGIWVNHSQQPVIELFQTGIGEQNTFQLGDSSQIQLDTDTMISVHFTEKTRRIQLAKGRAFFDVTRDLHRPFLVETPHAIIRALGTEFSVFNKNGKGITVAVLEGSVLVSQNPELRSKFNIGQSQSRTQNLDLAQMDNANEPSKRIPPIQEIIVSGEEIQISNDVSVYEVKSTDISQIEGWRKGRLHFKKTPLSRIIEAVNRYRKNKIIIDDEQLENYELTINFDVKSGEHFLPALEKLIPITIQPTTDGQVIIAKKDSHRL